MLNIGETMNKIRYGKWAGWIAPVVMLLRLFVVITAQPGFLSISCGPKTNHTAENGITWVTDADYIDVGQAADIGDASYKGSYFHSLRFFPKPLNKSCYKLPVAHDVPHLVRLWFDFRNSIRFQNTNFAFSIETEDMLYMQTITCIGNQLYYEKILVTSGRVLYICLGRTLETDDPFISAIELRTLQDDMYHGFAKPEKILVSLSRFDVGGNSLVRYPQDKFDRIWSPPPYSQSWDIYLKNISSKEPISTNNTKNLPPIAVMQTACVVNSSNSISLQLYRSAEYIMEYSVRETTLLLLYFAEMETNISRSFYVAIDGNSKCKMVTNHSALEISIRSEAPNGVELLQDANSTLPPIINAYEQYLIVGADMATDSQDIDALDAIRRRFDIQEWISPDPCYFIPWDGIGCSNSLESIRISEIDLSGRNLTGSVPYEIGKLTFLLKMYLQNNNLSGTLEWLSELPNLQELYLQNNNLSGTLEWLSELPNLQELNIENNNFSGAIPAQLLLDCSLKLSYSGNPYLRMDTRECNHTNNHKNRHTKLMVVLGILLFIALIVVDQVVKLRIKREGVATESSGAKKELEYSMLMVPNPTKSRAFTQDEIIAATQSFSREIGRGGFGSVFFGILSDGNVIAVKVLSLFSRQGIHEFLNEVDLLSKVNHRNLVSLLGYCNETKEVMLIYEHMSGGSLRDHLYGSSAENSDLSWKRRLKIALDAAQGLEYLHVSCTPKIIHRDIKTANILLDSNLNGKLADFGLSKMTMDGDATHVTTAVKGTFGYVDPEYFITQMLTEKSDVYSFGVVLLEIICGRQPIDIKLPEEAVNIIRWVTPYLLEMDENGGKIIEIIDKRLCGGYEMRSMTRVARIAMRCVEAAPSCRPSASEVVAELKKAIKHEDKVSISISEQIGIKNGDLLAGPADSTKREGMEWSDNSTNISKVGR